MATWKRLTGLEDAEQLDVNMDQVAYIQWIGASTTIYFVGGGVDGKVYVKETPDEIHNKLPISVPGKSGSQPLR